MEISKKKMKEYEFENDNLYLKLNISNEFKIKIDRFIFNLTGIDSDLKLDFDIKKKGDDVLLTVKNIKKINKKNIDVLKYVEICDENNEQKKYRILKDIFIESGNILMLLFNDDGNKKAKMSKKKAEEKKNSQKKQEIIKIDNNDLVLSFESEDNELQNSFFNSEEFTKLSKLYECLYNNYSLIDSETKIYIKDNLKEVIFQNAFKRIYLTVFFDKMLNFTKNIEISSDVSIEIDKNKKGFQINLNFNLEDDVNKNVDKISLKRKNDNDDEEKNKKIKK